MGKKKVILDTNVLISALGWGGKSYEIVDLGFAGAFKWVISTPIFEELIRALDYPKLSFIDKEEKEEFISAISESAEFIEVDQKLEEKLIDPKDQMFLECALEIDADYLVSGDKHLLSLGSVGKTKIIYPAKFLSTFKK